MPYIYVSKKADKFANPVFHRSRRCGSVDLLDDNDTLLRYWRRYTPGIIIRLRPFKKPLRRCIKC